MEVGDGIGTDEGSGVGAPLGIIVIVGINVGWAVWNDERIQPTDSKIHVK